MIANSPCSISRKGCRGSFSPIRRESVSGWCQRISTLFKQCSYLRQIGRGISTNKVGALGDALDQRDRRLPKSTGMKHSAANAKDRVQASGARERGDLPSLAWREGKTLFKVAKLKSKKYRQSYRQRRAVDSCFQVVAQVVKGTDNGSSPQGD